MAIHIGLLAGWWGLVVAGVCFILPAAIIVTALAWFYVSYGELPEVAGILYSIKPVIIAVVVQALWRLGRSSIKTWLLGAVALLAIGLQLLDVNELLVLLLAGLVVVACGRFTRRPQAEKATAPAATPGLAVLPVAGAAAAGGAAVPFGLWPLFLFFLKVGSVLFGSGYVLLAFLRADLVERWEWLTEQQLLDAIAIGQATPGPVFTTATFIGYVLGGLPGALVATVGIFLPAFFFVAISGPLVPRLRRSKLAGDFLDGVVAGSLALMAVVTWQLGQAALVDPFTVGLALASALLLLWFRINSAWLVLAGALIGLIVTVVAQLNAAS